MVALSWLVDALHAGKVRAALVRRDRTLDAIAPEAWRSDPGEPHTWTHDGVTHTDMRGEHEGNVLLRAGLLAASWHEDDADDEASTRAIVDAWPIVIQRFGLGRLLAEAKVPAPDELTPQDRNQDSPIPCQPGAERSVPRASATSPRGGRPASTDTAAMRAAFDAMVARGEDPGRGEAAVHAVHEEAQRRAEAGGGALVELTPALITRITGYLKPSGLWRRR